MTPIESVPDALRVYLMLDQHEAKPVLPIFIGTLPPEPEECIALQLYGDAGSTEYFGTESGLDEPLILCTIRSVTYTRGSNDAEVLRKLLSQKVVIDGFISVVPPKSVIHMGRDENNRHIFRCNIKTITIAKE